AGPPTPRPPSPGSRPEEELPAADEEVPAEPQPHGEQGPAAGGMPHDQPDGVAERRPPVVLVGQADPLPREQGPEQQRIDQVPDLHVGSFAERTLRCSRSGRSGYDLSRAMAYRVLLDTSSLMFRA